MSIKKVDRVPGDTKARLVVHTLSENSGRDRHTWVLGSPNTDGLRLVYLNGQEEGKGILLGSVVSISLGYMTTSLNVEIGRQLGVKFPDRPESECVAISTEVTAIIVMG